MLLPWDPNKAYDLGYGNDIPGKRVAYAFEGMCV